MMDEYETSRITKIRRLSEVNLATVTIYTDDLRLLLSLFERSQQENAKLRGAVEAVEWVMTPVGSGCPWCHASVEDDHAPDCQRQAALKGDGDVQS